MMWWTKAGGGKIERHDTQLSAFIRLNFARNMGKEPLEKLGLYRRDPVKFPGEPNLLPDMLARETAKRAKKAARES